ncbi:MAG: glycosyltransferase [Marinovum algicola]|jgi:glycosyltransferase involved in cell wall biosynthesis|uniref:Glycosyltransferase involved in cell wall bisynthesis n=1 Tax=Marinovum algicola TaxID=42444 RepID=A0A975ZN00_9RHOB|nr:glycosyltransferase [Marinovum algicola]SEJ27796.1 Glycosyltransferase involved in cell wall bisynthesis [Marinovum algicola]SLN46643.1 Glycogen synthase [Marinovum algicola]
MTGPLLYLTGEYPRATDTFIQREVAALRAQGITIMTASIRRTGPEHLVGEEQIAEAAQTFHVLEAAKHPLRLAAAKLRLLRHPGRFFRAFALVWRTAPGGLRNWLWQMFYFAEAIVLADHMQRHGVRHLHNHIAKASCTVAMLASELSGIPYSFTLHGPDIFFAPDHWRLDEKIARARFVACISEFCRAQAMIFSDRALWDKLHIVHCGIDPARYDPAPRQGPPHLTFVGRLAAVKGVPVLLEALSFLKGELPRLRVTLIGDGPERARLEQDAADLGLRDVVDFAGYRSQSEVARALKVTDALVLPSFAEGVPVVLMEAMAAGRPVITTGVAGVSELVEHGKSGFLVPPGDAQRLAQAIRAVLADPDRRIEMGRTGRTRVVEDFDIGKEAAWLGRLFEVYADGAAHPGKRP